MMEWTLQLSMIGPYGEKYDVAVPLSHHTATSIDRIEPPDGFNTFVPNGSALEETVKRIKRREFRKDLFQEQAHRLGTLLAEHMEDKEGWHGVDRQERLNQ